MGYIIASLVNTAYQVLSLLIVIRCIISFLPGINIYKEPIKSIIKITDTILDPIRNFLFKKGFMSVIDISPMIAIFLLGIIVRVVNVIFLP